MAIFNKNDERTGKEDSATIIANGTSIKGEINTKGSIHIDGYFNGDLKVANSIIIGTSGQVYGSIDSKSLIVSGFIEGEVIVDDIQILSTGKIQGKIEYKTLVIEQGGIFEGEGKVKKEVKKPVIEKNEKDKAKTK